MSEDNQGNPQSSEGDGVSATLQVATVITTSDKLIAEDMESESAFIDPNLMQFGISGGAFADSDDEDDDSASDDIAGAEKTAGQKAFSTAPSSATVTSDLPAGVVFKGAAAASDASGGESGSSSTTLGVSSFIVQTISEEVSEQIVEEDVVEADNDSQEEESTVQEPLTTEDKEPIEPTVITRVELDLETVTSPLSITDSSITEITNLAPSDIALSETQLQENLNTDNSSVKIADITITDDQYGLETLTITGQDADKLEIQGEGNTFSLYVKQGVVIDYETQNSLSFDLTATDTSNNGLFVTRSFTIDITPVADQPELTPGSHTQLFISDFEADTAGWLTDNPSGTFERNPETSYGGSDAGNRVLEVEAAVGDQNIYRTISTEPGKVYQLNFEFSPRQGYSDSTIDVLWDGNTVATLDGSTGTFGWQSHSLTLSGDGSDIRLEFKATDQNGVGGLLNDIELVELYATGLEDSPVSVNISSSLVDTDGSESLTLTASAIPAGAVLSDGANNFTAFVSGGTADISNWDISKLTITPPQHFNGDFDITFAATATESSTGQSSTTTETVTVTVLSVDDPLLVNNDAGTASLTDHILINNQGVLANDSDADSAISVISVNNQAVAASGTTRVDGVFGVLNINAEGQWNYTPDAISSDALNVAATDLQTGLVAHWRFDEGSGSTVADSSSAGSQNDTASLSGNAGFTTVGVSGSAINLDGSSGQVLIPDSADINTLTSLPARSISLAFNLDSNNSLTGRQILYEEGASVNGIAIYIENQTLYVGAYNKTTGWDGNYAFHDISGLSTDAWHHVALVLDDANNTLTAYLDGAVFPGGNVYGEAISNHSGDISIGGPSLDDGNASTNIFHDGEATGGYFSGSIDDVRVYNRVLADEEVEAVRYDFDLLTDQFQYTVASDQEQTVASLVINVTRTPIAIDGALSLGEDDLYTNGQLQASDYDAGDTLSYELVFGPDKGFVTLNTDGSYSFLPGNDFQSLADGESEQVSFSYRVSDSYGNRDTGSVQVTVSGADEPPQGSNLVTNPSAATGDLSGWTVTANGGSGWGVTGTSQEGVNGFMTSYDWNSKYQLIDLQANGYSTEDLDNAPDIYASDWYVGIGNTSDSYYFKVELRDAAQTIIDSFDTGTLTASGTWQEVSHTFSSYGAGLRYIYVEHGGKDAEYWTGHYGTVIDNTQIIVDLPESQVDNQNIVGIQNSQLLIQEGDQAAITLRGGIVSDSGFSSIDQWYLNHQGGVLTVTAETLDGLGWSSAFRLFSAELNGQTGAEVGLYSAEIPISGSASIISLDNLPAGHYLLAVGNTGFSESEATSMLDYANNSTGNHDYQLVITGNTDVQTMPRDPGGHAQIESQVYDNPEAQIQFTVDFNSENMALDTDYHFELLNGDTRLSQGQATFPADQSSVEITATINNETLASITMDDILIRFYEVDENGLIQDSQTFEFDTASVPEGDVVTPAGGDGLQGAELVDLGLAVFELNFSEIMDDMQNPLPG